MTANAMGTIVDACAVGLLCVIGGGFVLATPFACWAAMKWIVRTARDMPRRVQEAASWTWRNKKGFAMTAAGLFGLAVFMRAATIAGIDS
jgi:hypothetical protein